METQGADGSVAAEAYGLDWGFALLGIGSLLLLASAAIRS